jgi:cytochrome c551/c552
VWGPVPMPPHPQINDADRLKLATWALAGGK